MAPRTNEDSNRPNKRRKIDFGADKTITILVGSGPQKFVAQRDMLTESSSYFRSALKPSWQESKDRKIKLLDHDPTAFSIYLNWLFSGVVDVLESDEVVKHHTNQYGKVLEEAGWRYHRIIHSYILGDYIGDVKFCDALIDSYFNVQEATWQWPGIDACNTAFEGLEESSKLRLLLAHHIAFSSDYDSFTRSIDKFHPEVVKQIAVVCVRDRNAVDQTMVNRGSCYYHMHEDGAKCKNGA